MSIIPKPTGDIYTRNCISCKPIDQEEAERTIFTTPRSRVVLRTDDQSWPGRCIVVPRKHTNSFKQMSKEDRDDVYQCREKISLAYTNLFGMIRDNWLELGNLTVDHEGNKTTDEKYFHIHYHIIPRYNKPVEYLGLTFNDTQFAKALNIDPASGHKKVVITREQIIQMRDEIQEELIKQGLISEENLRDTRPSQKIIDLCKRRQKEQPQSHFWLLTGVAGVVVAALGVLTLTRMRSHL